MLRLPLYLLVALLIFTPTRVQPQSNNIILVVSYSPDGTYVAGVGDHVVIWDGMTSEVIADIVVPLQTAYTLLSNAAWSPDSNRLAVAGDDGRIRILDLSDGAQPFGALLAEFEVMTFLSVGSIAWSPDGSFLVIGGDGTLPRLEFWDASTYEFLRTSPYIVGADRMAWHPDPQRNLIAVTSRNLNGARLADTSEDANSSPIWVCSSCAPDAIAFPLAWNSDGTLLAIGHNDGSIFVVDADTDTVVTSMQTAIGVRGLAWTSDDQYLLSMSRGGLQVWDSVTGALLNDPTSIDAGVFAINPVNNQIFNFYNEFDVAVNIDVSTLIEPSLLALSITVPPTDGTILTTQDDTRFQAMAYDPAVGTNDGDGIQGVEFEIRDSADTLLYSAADTMHAYCAFGGDGPCNVAPGPVTSASPGTYTLRARAQSTGGTWTDWVVRTFVIGDSPTPAPTDTPVATATDVPVPTATEPPATPPILFTSDRDGNHEIYAMNPDGSSQTRLTDNTAMDIYPAWFPDHSRLVFASNRDSAGLDVYTMLPDGSSVTRLTTSSGDDYGGNVSPDGTQIAFVSSRDGDLEIYVMNADGSGQTQLTSNSAIDSLPSWTADGTRITFTSFRDGNMELYSMNPDGSGQTRLTNSASQEYGPVWSPDGSKMALVSTITGNADIFVANADGTGGTQLTNHSAADGYTVLSGVSHFGLSWSPDGSKIVFISTRDGNLEVYVMNADGSGQTRLTTTTAIESFVDW